jgi:hypothetical protein
MDINWTHVAPTVLAAFLASLVEFVEALTVVLAVSAVRGGAARSAEPAFGLSFSARCCFCSECDGKAAKNAGYRVMGELVASRSALRFSRKKERRLKSSISSSTEPSATHRF